MLITSQENKNKENINYLHKKKNKLLSITSDNKILNINYKFKQMLRIIHNIGQTILKMNQIKIIFYIITYNFYIIRH